MKRGIGQHRITWPASMRVRMTSSRLYISTPGPRHSTMPSACARYVKRYVYVLRLYKLFVPILSCEKLLAHIQPTVEMLLLSACILCKRYIDKGLVVFSCISQQKTAWKKVILVAAQSSLGWCRFLHRKGLMGDCVDAMKL